MRVEKYNINIKPEKGMNFFRYIEKFLDWKVACIFSHNYGQIQNFPLILLVWIWNYLSMGEIPVKIKSNEFPPNQKKLWGLWVLMLAISVIFGTVGLGVWHILSLFGHSVFVKVNSSRGQHLSVPSLVWLKPCWLFHRCWFRCTGLASFLGLCWVLTTCWPVGILRA